MNYNFNMRKEFTNNVMCLSICPFTISVMKFRKSNTKFQFNNKLFLLILAHAFAATGKSDFHLIEPFKALTVSSSPISEKRGISGSYRPFSQRIIFSWYISSDATKSSIVFCSRVGKLDKDLIRRFSLSDSNK